MYVCFQEHEDGVESTQIINLRILISETVHFVFFLNLLINC